MNQKLSDPNRRRRIIAGILALVVFPFVAIVAFYSGTHIVNVPGGRIAFTNGLTQSFVVSTATHTVTSSTLSYVTTSLTTISTINLPNLIPAINLPLGGIATGAELGLVISMTIILVVLFRSIAANRDSKTKAVVTRKDLESSRIEVASVLDDTAFRIKTGLGYKESVLECYRAISDILERRTGIDGRTLTAREFERSTSEILQLNSPYLRELTELFEVAKYSLKDITRDEANRALQSLESLSEVLRGRNEPETIASRNTSA